MNDPDLLKHLEAIDQVLGSLDPSPAVGFGLLCLERQMTVLRRALNTATWAKELAEDLRIAIDETWDLMSSGRFDSARAAPPDLLSYIDRGGGNADAVAYHVLNAAADFLSSVQEGDFGYGGFTATRNLELVEMLIDEMEHPFEVADPLFRAEMQRQNRDLRHMQSSGGAAIQLLTQQEDILGGLWFE